MDADESDEMMDGDDYVAGEYVPLIQGIGRASACRQTAPRARHRSRP